MAALKTQFTRKLHIAFGVLLLITLSVAWYFFDSMKWSQHDLEAIARSNDLLNDYQTLSDLTFQHLYEMTEAVIRNNPDQLAFTREETLAVRRALSEVRQNVLDFSPLAEPQQDTPEFQEFAQIERVVEDIVHIGTTIDLALATGRSEEAQAELARLRSEGLASRFSALMESAIDQQKAKVRAAHEEAVGLASYVTRALPVLMSVMVLLTVAVVYLFSRSLTRSVGLLYHAVEEFAGGNLQHRIPEINEREFYELGEAFNSMARELSEHRTSLHDANVRLEAMVEERTRALKESNEKLAKVDENRRKLLADISHEFRTPLTVIKGESEIALRGNKSREDYRESLRRIIETADHTTRLVDDLLFIVRADAGEPRLEIRPVAILSLIDRVCGDFEASAKQKDVQISQSSKARKAMLRGDADRLRQVFNILIDNALRYSNPGGKIQVGIEATENEIMITVKDEGIGLTAEEARQAFQRFYRGRQAAGHARGTGLGLPVAKAIVEAHGGRITLEGRPDQGAVATVTLPIESSLRAVA